MNLKLPLLHPKRWLSAAALTGIVSLWCGAAAAQERIPWKTSKIIGSPSPPPPYTTEQAFPGIKFNSPVEMAAAPGSDRLFVLELKGKAYSFVNQKGNTNLDLLVDLSKTKD